MSISCRVSGNDKGFARWHPEDGLKFYGVVPLEDFERRYILKVLKITDWRVSGPRGAAILLGLPPSTLYSKIKKLRIKRP